MNDPESSVSEWIERLRKGDPDAAAKLWHRYFEQLVRLARAGLRGLRRGPADEEDVALSAFDGFYRAVKQEGRWPQLQDRGDLWRLLITIVERKAADVRRREMGQKRGGRARLGDSALMVVDGQSGQAGGLAAVPAPEPTPAFAAQMAEHFQRFFARLTDPLLRQTAELKMRGHTDVEIAREINRSLSTVERYLRLIRTILKELDE